MNNSAMNNQFAIGDLVHLPQGTTLYKLINAQKRLIYDRPMPSRIVDRPSVGLIIEKSIYDFYVISIGLEEFLVKSEEAFMSNGDLNVYKTA